MAGLEAGEIDDLTDIVEVLHEKLSEDRTLTNLPRKFKISLSGSPAASQPEINDVGIYAFWKTADGRKEPAYALRLGGGLSAFPMFSKLLPVALKRDDIFPVALAVAGIFRDYGNRENRKRARMKFLVEDWGTEKFLSEIEKRLGRTLERCNEIPSLKDSSDRFFGVFSQRQAGLYAVGLAVPAGRLKSGQILQLAELAERYGSGDLRTTPQQNLILVNVPEKNIPALRKELEENGFDLGENGVSRGTVTCTGMEFCNLALTETKIFTLRLIERLRSKFPKLKEGISIHVSGCPNSCGQYQTADIGLVGTLKMTGPVRQEAYHIAVGGHLGENEIFNRQIFKAVPAENVPEVLEFLIRTYLKKRNAGESFSSFVNRFGAEKLIEGWSAASSSPR